MKAPMRERLYNMWRSALGLTTYSTTDIFPQGMLDPGYNLNDAGQRVNIKTAMQVSAAMACGRVIAEGIAQLPMEVMKQTVDEQNSTRKRLPEVAHSLYDLLWTGPNDYQSAFEFKELLLMHLVFTGNAYVWVERVGGETSRARVVAMHVLEPTWVRINWEFAKKPTFVVNVPNSIEFSSTTLKFEEVWHIKGPSWCSYLGLEMFKIARMALGLSMAVEASQANLYQQGITQSGYISIDGTLQEEQQKKLRNWIEKEHTGSSNAHRPMILDRAAKWITTSMSNVDAQTEAMRNMQIEEICRFMRVMPIMVGMTRGTSQYASAEQMFLAHLVHTLGPWVTRLESSATKFLLTPVDRTKGRYVKFNEKVLHRMTAADQMNFLKGGALTGILTRNEARDDLDYNPLPGLDDPLTPVNEIAGEPPTKDDMQPNDTGQSGGDSKPPPKDVKTGDN
jgi:HK97 family phage portal protein